ncbi:hypothetical protein GCM10023116_18700 [Kistimonas scapharcae]|uniref:Sel1 repeat family protein n=1 Tax=Kistimonas scapharcae TaxID=1036133 RepID=A0ABP8V2Y4_9GAMM
MYSGDSYKESFSVLDKIIKDLKEYSPRIGFSVEGAFHRSEDALTEKPKTPYELYKQGADKGDKIAQYNLARLYENGNGVIKDYQKAFYWYEKSASQGFALAQYNFAHMYDIGKGIPQNFKKAAYWYEKAAKQNYLLITTVAQPA